MQLLHIYFSIFLLSFFQHNFFLAHFLQVADENLLSRLSPDSDALISANRDHIVANRGESKTPDSAEEAIKHEDFFMCISVDHFDFSVFRGCADVVSVFDEFDLCDRVLVDEHAFVDVTELHAPNLEVLIS